MKRMPSLLLVVLISVVLASPPSAAWCNKQRQPGRTPTQQGENFQLPAVESSENVFSFAKPDPSRQLRQVEYQFDPDGKSVYHVVISEDLNPEQAKDAQATCLEILQEAMCHPGDVAVIWSGSLRRIATFRNDERVRDCSSATSLRFKVHSNQAEIAGLNRHFEELRKANRSGKGDLDIPHIAHHLGQEFHEFPDFPNRALILFGSAVHVSGERGAIDLTGAYPTVGMLRAPFSPFSTIDKAFYLGNTTTHFISTDRIRDSVHLQGLQNFFSAYFLSQGSPLLTFSIDTRIADRLRQPGLPAIPAYLDDPTPGFVSIRPLGLFDDEAVGSVVVSDADRAAVLIGLRWEGAQADLDLHVGLRGQSERLSFRQPTTSFGNFGKRYETGWEVAQLANAPRPQDVELWVNFYEGSAAAGVVPELRVRYAGRVYRTRIELLARSGNRGAVGSAEHWWRGTLADVLAAAE